MSQHIWNKEEEQELPVFVRKGFEVLNKLDSGAFGQVFKTKLKNKLYAVKRIAIPGNRTIIDKTFWVLTRILTKSLNNHYFNCQ